MKLIFKLIFLLIAVTFSQCRKDIDIYNSTFEVRNAGQIESLICDSIHYFGNLVAGTDAENVSFVLYYTGGNGDTYGEISAQSTNVEGLYAELNSSLFEIGPGSLEFIITGIPLSTGTARFTIRVGGVNCEVSLEVYETLYPINSIFCSGITQVVDVLNPVTGRIWMDRNLGASQAANSTSDKSSYGYLYQWGRFSDGHQCRNSGLQTELSNVSKPQNSNFITVSTMPFDWLTSQDDVLWEINSSNNPCPNGYRLPTPQEFLAEVQSWNSKDAQGAYESVLKLPASGHRHYANGVIYSEGSMGYYWTNGTDGIKAIDISFDQNGVKQETVYRADGSCVRCIKN